jgi:orsellinic acid C2-O-methyltransferase
MTALIPDDKIRLQQMIAGYMVSQVIHVAVTLGLPDLLETGEASAQALAKETGTHDQSLARLLRALAACGLVEEPQPGCLKLTAFGALLRADVPGSLRNLALALGGETMWRSWGDLLHAVSTGANAFEHLFGMRSFEHASLHPDRAAIFDAYMADLTRASTVAILASHDFSAYRSIVDVGGGNGALLSEILVAAPAAECSIFDTPSGVAGAMRRLEQAGVARRCRVVTGDFFKSVPEGADAYILKSVLLDWEDERALAILENSRGAMRLDSVLLIVERLLPERIECCEAHREITMMDLHMLVMPGGRERTGVEYAELCASVGLELIRTKQTGSPFAIMQARKIDARTSRDGAQDEEHAYEPRIYRPCRRRRPLSRHHRLRGRCR